MGPLSDGGRVIIIGGGPAGTSCALSLHNYASQLNRKIQINLIEGKTFEGETHFNQCAGVLSPPLSKLLEENLKISFPNELVQEEIQGYILHAGNEQVKLDEVDEPSLSLRRVNFDAYMLDAVKQRGIPVWPTRMTDLEFHANGVRVFTDQGSCQADVIVGAFGLDEGSGALLSQQTNYRAPKFFQSIVTKCHPSPEMMEAFGRYIHAFLPPHPRIEFGAITPKRDHLTINIAGSDVDANIMYDWLNSDAVQSALLCDEVHKLTNDRDLRLFKGRFPSSLARGYYGDRYVLVGDSAGLVRAFKGKGVTSAVQTGIRAAETIMYHGISGDAFHNAYRTSNQDIIGDMPFGQGMRLVTGWMTRFGIMPPVVRAAQKSERLSFALFDAVSARGSYQRVIAQTLSPKIVLAVLGEMFFADQ
jgi:flavin-dependent dehydrogenase